MKALNRVTRLLLVVCLFVFGAASVATAQCVNQASGKTAIGVMNASDYFITFAIDDGDRVGVPAQERSIDFAVSPGEHVLRAETVHRGETLSATRTLFVPVGAICTWNVTNPTMIRRPAVVLLTDALQRSAFVSVAVPN